MLQGTFIKGGDAESVENYKYDFHLGDRILKASVGQPVKLTDLEQDKRYISPGEAVFVLTQERLDLPDNIMATLVPKRKMAHSGVLVLGGFAIDPSYKGFILLGLYNFSSTPFPLREGKKIVAALFYDVSNEENQNTANVPEAIDDFPDELVRLIQSYKPVELNGLSEAIFNLRSEFNSLRTEVTTDKTWRDEFRNSLNEHNKQIDKLLEGLREERDVRRADDEKLESRLSSMSSMLFGWNWTRLIAAAIFVAALSAAFGYFIPKIFTHQ